MQWVGFTSLPTNGPKYEGYLIHSAYHNHEDPEPTGSPLSIMRLDYQGL